MSMKRSPEWYEQYEQRRLGKAKAAAEWNGNVVPIALERDVLRAVLETLQSHPRVAWAFRMNAGAMEVAGRYVKFAFKGCSDIIGQMKTGQFLAVECKRHGKVATLAQASFLDTVNRHGGIGFVATSVDDVLRVMKEVA